MLRFHPLAIANRAPVADDAIALTLAVPSALAEEFRFRAGQHLALKQVIDGQEERRTYSIVNPEGSAALTIGIPCRRTAGCRNTSRATRKWATRSTC